MKDIVNTLACLLTVPKIFHISLNKSKPAPCLFPDHVPDIPEIIPMAGCEVVETDNPLAQFQAFFKNIRADESSAGAWCEEFQLKTNDCSKFQFLSSKSKSQVHKLASKLLYGLNRG